MVAYLRKFFVFGTSLALVDVVSLRGTSKTNSRPCTGLYRDETSPSDWTLLTMLRIGNPGSPLKSASGSVITKNSNVKCHFDVYFGFNPFGEFYQVDQRVECEKALNIDFRISYEDERNAIKDFSLDSGGAWRNEAKCDTFAGDFKLDAGQVKIVTVYQKK